MKATHLGHKVWCHECSKEIPYLMAVRDGYSKRLVCRECYTNADSRPRQYKPRSSGINPAFISPDLPERTTNDYIVRWGFAAPFHWGQHNVQNEVFWAPFIWGENE